MLTVEWQSDGYAKISLGKVPVFDIALSYAASPELAQAQRDLVGLIVEAANKTQKKINFNPEQVMRQVEQALAQKPDPDMGKVLQWK